MRAFCGAVGARWRRWSRWRRAGAIAGLILGLAVTTVAASAVALRLEYAGDPPPDARTRGRDAVWLGHAWVDGRKTDADIAALATLLSGTGVKDLFVHTGPFARDGSVPDELHPRARWFVDAVHRSLPGIRVQSWLGQLVEPEFDDLDMAVPATRAQITASAVKVLDLGFDGVHLDLEPVRSGSGDFLSIVDQVGAVTRGRAVPLSVSAPQIDPLPGLHSVGIALREHGKWWSQAYFAEVARRVDQVALMSYDTAMPTESLYGGYVAQQTALALAVTPAQVDLLMGAPAFWADDIAHHGAAETVPAAIRGIRLGLGREDRHRQTFGVALYVDFAATPEDWAAYRRDWC
ncbi:glycoside hydrolase family 18 protein [Nocardia goodfellowii]|uniref:GH18 domain-containing protein n=1 Tax=Nocardia goodfellowii TaxID=882446 RepID=A0ABS4QBR3_9NOCA|nr:hypothetical protein [Nocardia goodfellowii]MBP2189139.1 hypothetical protein [Nocardia goodfellowii]